MKKILMGIVILIIALNCQLSFAQENDGWKFTIAPFLWLAGIDANLASGTTEVDGDVDFPEILEKSWGAGMLEIGARKGQVFFLGDVMFVGVEGDLDALLLSGDRKVKNSLVLSQFMLGYSLDAIDVGENMTLTIEPTIGMRNYWNRFTIDRLNGGELRDINLSWTDFVVGGIVTLSINEKWSLLVRADVGGFGWESSSDLSWMVGAFADYHWTETTTIRLGYNVLDIDKYRDPGRFGFEKVDLQIRGPVIAAIFTF
jgi:hypothetical protein